MWPKQTIVTSSLVEGFKWLILFFFFKFQYKTVFFLTFIQHNDAGIGQVPDILTFAVCLGQYTVCNVYHATGHWFFSFLPKDLVTISKSWVLWKRTVTSYFQVLLRPSWGSNPDQGLKIMFCKRGSNISKTEDFTLMYATAINAQFASLLKRVRCWNFVDILIAKKCIFLLF